MRIKLEKQIQDLTQAIHATSKMSDEQILKVYGVSKKEALYNSTFALLKLIGEIE